jgi:protein-S-isoprenylcysteine O-methyltransferase Ste14
MVADPARARDLRLPYCGGVLPVNGAYRHVFGVLSYLLILAFPLMHFFMHHGHRGGHGQAPPPNPDKEGKGRRCTEEREALREFGDQYRAYMQRVAAFLPRLGTRPSTRTS